MVLVFVVVGIVGVVYVVVNCLEVEFFTAVNSIVVVAVIRHVARFVGVGGVELAGGVVGGASRIVLVALLVVVQLGKSATASKV